jgi:Mg/Co/Ni transporter MgtE
MDKRSLLNSLTVEDIWELVVDNPSTIGLDIPIVELLEKMVEDTRTRHVYVVDEQQHLVGVVRMTAVTGLLFPLQALNVEMSDPYLFQHVNLGGRTVRDVMDKKPHSVRADTGLQDLARVLLKEKITELPVIDKANLLIGQVNMYEIIKAYLQLRQA